MGVSKYFSPWFTVPSEQGCCSCTDWSRASHCKTPHMWRAFLPPTDLISLYRMLGQGQHNSEVFHSWYLCLVWWHDGIVQGQMDYTTTAGLVMPCLPCPCCCDESSLCFCTDPDTFCQSATKLVSRLHLNMILRSQYALMKGVFGVQQRPNIFRMHIYLLKMPTSYSSIF